MTDGTGELKIGDAVRVDIAGRVIGRSEYEQGPDAYLVEYERAGKKKREWIVADALVAATSSDAVPVFNEVPA
ncbi:hypothetical protein LB533_20565 [Mesorhizobium sp. BR1-1-13]|uniref:hypothetical protein n=1 Tax=Mesorhizobium sp. BR1-1-13 TaxID=2876656 RepID=UPI001CD18BAD|nr:hypothetical protein [Mesorhizobium sp. BR1-1-13]MBZ9943483.1 hypothetical protein [Mesorhizobium sp. BR1-1-13]